MRLLEYQAKTLFKEYGIRVPNSYVVRSIEEARKYSNGLGFPLVAKAQVRAGGRGKAGIIKVCRDVYELDRTVNSMLGSDVKGEIVKSILLEEFIPHDRELYLSIFLDRSKRRYTIIASNEGGVDIESVGNKLVKPVDIFNYDANESVMDEVASYLGLNEGSIDFIDITKRLLRLVNEKEAELAEINPLAVVDSTMIALDAKIIIDDNALFRHEELRVFEEQDIETEARKSGFSLVELDGSIAVVGNGAGLVMSTIDMLSDANGRAACFLDVGGGATLDNIYKALTLISRLDKVKAILVNLFGGIVDTSIVAQAIVNVYKDNVINVPLFARIAGRNADIAKDMLRNSKAMMLDSVEEAISHAVNAVKR